MNAIHQVMSCAADSPSFLLWMLVFGGLLFWGAGAFLLACFGISAVGALFQQGRNWARHRNPTPEDEHGR